VIPYADKALGLLAGRLLGSVVPDLKSPYAQSDATLTAQLLAVLGAELAAGVERRMQDINAMQALFGTVAPLLADAALAARLQGLIGHQPASLLLVDVNALHDELTRALVTLHSEVDGTVAVAAEAAAAQVNDLVWAYLEAQAERHHIPG
jgi:hypothetical protein